MTMFTVFWNSKGIIHTDFLYTGYSINGGYYRSLLNKFHKKISSREKMRVIFLQDNSPVHKENASIDKITSRGWKVIDHPQYSPDLAPSDFYLFRNMKSEMIRSSFD